MTSIPRPSVIDRIETDAPSLNWHQRLEVLHNDYKFLPTTVQELNMGFGAVAFLLSPGGVGGHLNEVLLHQMKNPVVELPDKAVRAVVRDMAAFHDDAGKRREGLLALHNYLKEDVNPELEVEVLAEEIAKSIGTIGLLSSLQHQHIFSRSLALDDKSPLEGGIKAINGKKRLVTAYDSETQDVYSFMLFGFEVTKMSVRSFRDLIIKSGQSHRARRDKWAEILESTTSHSIARPIVREILSKAHTY